MALLSSARVALQQGFSAASPPVASPGLGAVVGRTAEVASPAARLHHGPLVLGRLLSSEASAASTQGAKRAANVEMDLIKLHEQNSKEFFHLLEAALKTCDPAKTNLVLEKHRELGALVREYQSMTRPKTAQGEAFNFWKIVSAVVSGYFIASTLKIIVHNYRHYEKIIVDNYRYYGKWCYTL